jgi:hypothetical protein
MNRIRTLKIALAAGALVLAAAAPSFAVKLENVRITSYQLGVLDTDLPAPPKLAAPKSGPGTPHTAKETDRTSVPLAQPGSIGPAPSKKKSLKLK